MRNKLHSWLQTDKFSYFIRYFAVFTFIFVSMTLIILQVMQSTVYKSSDDSLAIFAENPKMMVEVAAARSSGARVDIILDKGQSPDQKKEWTPSTKMNLNANLHILLYDKDGHLLNEVDNFSGLDQQTVEKTAFNQIEETQVSNPFGEYEIYRSVTIKAAEDLYFQGKQVRYASVFINTTQLKTSIELHQSTILMVMTSFWLVSIFASIYLSVLSVRPILASFQKQKEFVENASHELRTPLAVLQNRLETLFRKPEATILESSESIASSLEEVRNMRLLTTNLLHLARRDDGLKPTMTKIDPSFFDEVFENYRMVAQENGKEFQARHQLHQPFVSDKTLLKQLMTILFDNALKYTEQDGEIGMDVCYTEKWLLLSVRDNGLGISDEDKKKIFDRFYRVDKARTRQKGGFGLGLSLAKQILTTLKGSITVKDNTPKGTIFEVKLPR